MLSARIRSLAVPALLGMSLVVGGCSGNITPEQYGAFANTLLTKGHLRTDRAPPDAPYTNVQLAQNFRDIAFQYEFQFEGNRVVNRPLPKPLNRWQQPIRYRLIGDSVTRQDEAEVAELMALITDLTGLEAEPVKDGQNMLISIASPEGRKDISRMFGAAGQFVFQSRYDTWRETPGWICGATLSVEPSNPNVLVGAHVFMGSEVTGTLRRACLHEEIVQSLGLTNDSRSARPSIFNDDQEFALLTEHDALLLRVLYDPHLHPGMGEAEAMPIAEQIIRDLRAGLSSRDGRPMASVRTLRRGARPPQARMF